MRANGVSEARIRKAMEGSPTWQGGEFDEGEWGGEHELQALAQWKGIHIAVWNLRGVQRSVARVYMANGSWRNMTKEVVDIVAANHRRERGIRTVHVVYNGSHYEPLANLTHPPTPIWGDDAALHRRERELLYDLKEGGAPSETIRQHSKRTGGESRKRNITTTSASESTRDTRNTRARKTSGGDVVAIRPEQEARDERKRKKGCDNNTGEAHEEAGRKGTNDDGATRGKKKKGKERKEHVEEHTPTTKLEDKHDAQDDEQPPRREDDNGASKHKQGDTSTHETRTTNTRRCTIASLNANGVRSYMRKVAKAHGKKKGDTEGDTAYYASDKVASICQIFQSASADYMLIVDAHVTEGEDARAMQQAITQHMPSVEIHVSEPVTNRTGGLVVMWDAKTWDYTRIRAR